MRFTDYLDRPLREALKDGMVAQVTGKPFVTCGSISPETQTNCQLYPGHESAHSGERSHGRVSWAYVEEPDDSRSRTRELAGQLVQEADELLGTEFNYAGNDPHQFSDRHGGDICVTPTGPNTRCLRPQDDPIHDTVSYALELAEAHVAWIAEGETELGFDEWKRRWFDV